MSPDPSPLSGEERAALARVATRHFLTTGDPAEFVQRVTSDALAAVPRLNPLAARVEELERAVNWALGCGDADDFPISEKGGRYAWRGGLARRAGMVYDATSGRYRAAPPTGGTPE